MLLSAGASIRTHSRFQAGVEPALPLTRFWKSAPLTHFRDETVCGWSHGTYTYYRFASIMHNRTLLRSFAIRV